jgi:hypothetical protein
MSHRGQIVLKYEDFQEGSGGAAPVFPQTVSHPGKVLQKPEESSWAQMPWINSVYMK